MLTKIKDSIVRMIGVLEQFTASVKPKLGSALKIGKIITAIYSVYATIVLIFCGFMGHSLNWLTEYPGADLVFNVMLIISLITLVLSGGVIEALEILLRALEWGLSLASIPSGSFVALAISAVLFIIPLMIAGLVILCAPIIPVLIHWYRDERGVTE